MWKSLPRIATFLALTACGTTTAQHTPQSAAPTTELRQAYNAARADAEKADRDQKAAAAALRNMKREGDLATVALALKLYRADHGRFPAVDYNLLVSQRGPLVGPYLVKAVSPPTAGEVNCYGYDSSGQAGFISTWLEIEEKPHIAPLVDLSDDELSRIRSVLATRQNVYACPAVSGYTVRAF